MKIQQQPQNVKINGQFETSEFKTGDISFLVDMMSDYIYTNKVRAVLREVSVNGHDANVRNGTSDIPIEVRIPTSLDNTLSFRDSGMGLSDDGMRNTFCGIGISDKRDSDTETGCFGVGTLSPYSLVDSFSVTSYHGDHVVDYLCYRDEKRRPQVSELTRRLRNKDDHAERTGLLISMTVKDMAREFRKEAVHVFKHWEGTSVDISSKDVQSEISEVQDTLISSEDCILFEKESYGDRLLAFQGNICYEIPDFDWSNIGKDLPITDMQCRRFLAFNGMLKFSVKDDALSFDVSREKLENNQDNALKIKKKMAKVIKILSNDIINLVETGKTPLRQAQLAHKFSGGNLGRMVSETDGSKPSDLKKFHLSTVGEHTTWEKQWRGSTEVTGTRVKVGSKFDNSNGAKIKYAIHKPRMTTRIKSYLKDAQRGSAIVIFNDLAQVLEAKIREDELYDLDNLPKIVRNASSKKDSNGKVFSSYKTFTFKVEQVTWNSKMYFEESEIVIPADSVDPVVYVEINRYDTVPDKNMTGSACDLAKTLRLIRDAGYELPTVIALKSSFLQSAKFKKHNFVHIADWIVDNVFPDLPESKTRTDRSKMDRIKTFLKFMNHDEIEEIYLELVEKQGDKLHHQIQDHMDNALRLVNKKLSGYDKSVDCRWDEFESKNCLMSNISTYRLTDTDDDGGKRLLSETARYLGGTIIPTSDQLNEKERFLQISDKKSKETS